jgi:hypothetical protein
LRLVVPWLVGACTHAALQVYLEYRFWGRFRGSFFAFLPLFVRLKAGSGKRLLSWPGAFLIKPGVVYLFLRYANEAVLPFYILHQTVIVSVGFFVVRRAIPDLSSSRSSPPARSPSS